MKRVVCLLVVLAVTLSLRVGAISTSAKGAALINAQTGEVIYEKNARQRLPMASTTKIMTSLLLCEMGDMNREITVTGEMVRVEGTSMGLLAGDKVTFHDLLYGMLLASGNDAANVTAYALGGTVDGFVKLMNQKAASLGLKDTHFETPSGLDGDEHYTTAYDLAQLAGYAMENPMFYEAASSKSAVLCYGNPPYKRTLTNHNKLLKTFEGAVGVKTGFTKKSGRCLVSCAERDGKRVIAVTLNDGNDWADHTAMLNYGLEQIKTEEIQPEKSQYSIPVVSAEKNSVEIKIEPLKVNTVESGKFDARVNLPRFLYAPLQKDEVIGSVVYCKNGEEIDRREIKINEEIEKIPEKNNFKRDFLYGFKIIFKNIWES